MKSIFAFIALIFISSSSNATIFHCEWTAGSLKRHRCDGQNYVKGKKTCNLGVSGTAFCNEKYSENPNACSEDVEPETMRCNQKLFSVKDPELEASQTAAKSETKAPPPSTNSQPEKKNKEASKASTTSSSKGSEAPNSNVDHCRWKEPGVAYHECEGETFVYGHLECEHRGLINHLFCKAANEDKVDDCIGDNEPITVRCLSAMTGLRAKKTTNPVTTIPATTAPGRAVQ